MQMNAAADVTGQKVPSEWPWQAKEGARKGEGGGDEGGEEGGGARPPAQCSLPT